jgi:glycosyltransferase involved in cell wall biosynthesis
VARGGLDLHMRELSGSLEARGLEVFVHAMHGDGEGAPSGVEALAGRIADPLGDGPDVDDFRGALDLYRPDVVHFQSLQGLSHRLPEEAKRFGARVLWTLHDFFSICPRTHLHDGEGAPCAGPMLGAACGPCYGGLKGLLAAPVLGLRYAGFSAALGQCDHLLAPSRYVRDTLVAEGVAEDRIQVLAPAVPRPRRFAALPTADNHCPFVFAGDLRRAKGADLAVEAMAMLRDQPVSLRVHGGPPAPPAPREQQFEEQLQATARGSTVTFFGRYQPDELLPILDGAAALLVPSRVRESFGRTANLALMAGVPVIAAGHGAVPELVAEGVNGALFEPGNARSLAEAMRRVLEDGIDMQAQVEDWPANPSLDDHVADLVRLYGAQA